MQSGGDASEAGWVRVAAALHATRERIESEYQDARDACQDAAEKELLYSAPTAVAHWLPQSRAETTISPLYRDDSLLDDPAFVEEHLFGATKSWLQSLSVVDQFIIKFVLLRRLDVESACKRFFHLRTLLLRNRMTLLLNIDDEETRCGLGTGAFQMVPVLEAQHQRPVIAVLPRKLQVEGLPVSAMKKAWLYGIFTAAHWNPVAQTHGVMICNSVRGLSVWNQSQEFRSFILSAVAQCIPVRLAGMYIANEAFLARNVMLPAIKMAMSKKLRERFHIISEDYDRVLSAIPADCVPEEMGGRRRVELASEELVALVRAYDARLHAPSASA